MGCTGRLKDAVSEVRKASESAINRTKIGLFCSEDTNFEPDFCFAIVRQQHPQVGRFRPAARPPLHLPRLRGRTLEGNMMTAFAVHLYPMQQVDDGRPLAQSNSVSLPPPLPVSERGRNKRWGHAPKKPEFTRPAPGDESATIFCPQIETHPAKRGMYQF